jgi:hypothetical protein
MEFFFEQKPGCKKFLRQAGKLAAFRSKLSSAKIYDYETADSLGLLDKKLAELKIVAKNSPTANMTLRELLVGDVGAIAGIRTNSVYLAQGFFGRDPIDQGKSLFHELLHNTYGDVDLADVLGIKYIDNSPIKDPDAASIAIGKWVEKDCPQNFRYAPGVL